MLYIYSLHYVQREYIYKHSLFGEVGSSDAEITQVHVDVLVVRVTHKGDRFAVFDSRKVQVRFDEFVQGQAAERVEVFIEV